MTVLCVVGPTASGKTKMAVALARRLNGEVVSVDSMQIYRGMTIGTAAPTAEEMDGAGIYEIESISYIPLAIMAAVYLVDIIREIFATDICHIIEDICIKP